MRIRVKVRPGDSLHIQHLGGFDDFIRVEAGANAGTGTCTGCSRIRLRSISIVFRDAAVSQFIDEAPAALSLLRERFCEFFDVRLLFRRIVVFIFSDLERELGYSRL